MCEVSRTIAEYGIKLGYLSLTAPEGHGLDKRPIPIPSKGLQRGVVRLYAKIRSACR